jgi:hypothetical protein
VSGLGHAIHELDTTDRDCGSPTGDDRAVGTDRTDQSLPFHDGRSGACPWGDDVRTDPDRPKGGSANIIIGMHACPWGTPERATDRSGLKPHSQKTTGSDAYKIGSGVHTYSLPPPRVRVGRGWAVARPGWCDASAQERHGMGARGCSWLRPGPRGGPQALLRRLLPLAGSCRPRPRAAPPRSDQAWAPRQHVSSPLPRPLTPASSRSVLATTLRGGMLPSGGER